MRSGVLVACLALVGLCSDAVQAAAVCQQNDLEVEAGLWAEATLPPTEPLAAPLCGATEVHGLDCSEPEARGPALRPHPGRCSVHFGGAPRFQLHPGGRSAPLWDRMLLVPAPGRLQQAPLPPSSLGVDAALSSNPPAPSRPPWPALWHVSETAPPWSRGRLDRIERPPRPTPDLCL
ncbi:MAG: hypothetical protein RMK29_03335 [Myxococcales bacterium]|nr:hypothetical protein [Myxococcota bacterium]MDW8280718.1 hypothetical protein [Myxococcales bacterium]